MLSLAAVIGLGVTGVMLYIFTTENLWQYAVLSAMGAEPRVLLTMIFAQAGLCGLLGTGMGDWSLRRGWTALSYRCPLPVSHDVVRAPGRRHGGRVGEHRGRGAQRAPSAEVAAHGRLRTTVDWPQWIVLRRQKGPDGPRRIENCGSEIDPSPIL
jgi:hypothetical protein